MRQSPLGSALLVATVRAAQYRRERLALDAAPRNERLRYDYVRLRAATEIVALAAGAVAALVCAAGLTVVLAALR